MGSERLIALTDGVVAVVITIMVLELKPPAGVDLASLAELWPTFLGFVLSFVYVAIYWNNHHHFFQLVPHVNLLFWLSLIPFTTAWMDQHNQSAIPVAIYGISLLCCALVGTRCKRLSCGCKVRHHPCAGRWGGIGKASCRRRSIFLG